MKDCKTCIWYGKEKPGQCGNYLCRNQSEYDPRKGFEEEAVNDYIKRADVLELVMRGNLVSNRNYKSVMRLIMGIPGADVRPVVTCIECKHSCDMPGGLRCCHGTCLDCYVEPEFFCADGEREESRWLK